MPENNLHTVTGVLTYLSNTPFASKHVTPLSGGNANFIFRLDLEVPYEGRSTLVLKHAKPYVASFENMAFDVQRQEFEVEALRRVKAILPDDAIVTVPAVHLLDKEVNVVIMDDSGRFMLRSPPSLSVAWFIGAELGQFLGRLHSWGHGNDSLLDLFDKNQQGKQIPADFTYGRLVSVIQGAESLGMLPLTVSPAQLDVISELAKQREHDMQTNRETIAMGDFWPGNILISLQGDAKSGEQTIQRIHVVDWEATRPGHPGVDIGQFCAELYQLSQFSPMSSESADATRTAFLETYRKIHHADVELCRVAAVQIGVHLITWTPWAWEGKETIRDVRQKGVECLLQGYSGDEDWLRRSLVRSLIC